MNSEPEERKNGDNGTPTEPGPKMSTDEWDGRKPFEWNSKYPKEARIEQYCEAAFLFALYILSLFMLFATWKGWICTWLSTSGPQAVSLKKYLYFCAAGMLGGIIFGMKFFYRIVARGGWHQDRRFWRLKSPFIALVISMIIGTMIDSNVMTTTKPINGAGIVWVGFLAGYFADDAVGKMAEVASVVFGKSTKSGDGKSQDGKKG